MNAFKVCDTIAISFVILILAGIAVLGIWGLFGNTPGDRDLLFFCQHEGYTSSQLSGMRYSYCEKEVNNTIYRRNVIIKLGVENPLERYKFLEGVE